MPKRWSQSCSRSNWTLSLLPLEIRFLDSWDYQNRADSQSAAVFE